MLCLLLYFPLPHPFDFIIQAWYLWRQRLLGRKQQRCRQAMASEHDDRRMRNACFAAWMRYAQIRRRKRAHYGRWKYGVQRAVERASQESTST